MSTHDKYLRFKELVLNQRMKRTGENERQFEKREMDYIQALALSLLGEFAVVEADGSEKGEIYISLYIDGKAPKRDDLHGRISRRDNKKTIACGRSYNEIREQLEFLKKNDLLPRVITLSAKASDAQT